MAKLQNPEPIKISYDASVYTDVGWRGVTICADALKISERMAQLQCVTSIDGEQPTGYISRTGSIRQSYHAGGIAQREIGKKKRLSTCEVIA